MVFFSPLKRLRVTLNMLKGVKCAAGGVFPPFHDCFQTDDLALSGCSGDVMNLFCWFVIPFSLMLTSVGLFFLTFVLIKVILVMSQPMWLSSLVMDCLCK